MNNFDKNWRNAKRSIFRLEGRPEYRVPGEEANIAKWKQGELDLSKDKSWQEWMKLLKNAKTRGVATQRVRVAPKPLPDYIKYEINLWQEYSTKNGEEVFFINTGDYQEVIAGLGFNPKDFWLFDDDKLLIFNYSPSGQFSGEILIGDGGMIKRYSDLREKLLKKSIPLATFAAKM
jgi:hypothetical protein